MNIIEILTPRIAKRYLLFVAAVVWTIAGGMLLWRGTLMFEQSAHYRVIRLIFSIIGGLAFYGFLFSRISLSHTQRILNLAIEKPCFFSFFNLRSYILMAVMITAGITLRRTGIVPVDALSVVYVTMGIPLFMSSFRFYYTGILNLKTQ